MLKSMSLETRNSSALCKRAEQLKRWEESDTNRESVEPKNPSKRKIQFSSGCIFLAACVAGDKEEVERLLDDGADIDTSNVDGLTALHQACIDNNLEMVEFLIQRGSDINKKDNEGWTPLHATASCGFLSIARFLIENGADLAAVNSDGDLPIDIAYNDEMEDLIDKYVCEQGIDCVEARQTEEKLMLSDAKQWLRSNAAEADRPHPKTGATALHVAAAKGYTKVLSLLLAGRADVDKQDVDGWTPLHAAAYWGQKEACQMLVASMGDLDIKNFAGQTPLDIATKELVTVLEELKKNSKRTKRRPASQIRISDNIDNNVETPPKVIRVEVNTESKNTENCDDNSNCSDSESDSDGNYAESTDSTASSKDDLDDKPKAKLEPINPTPVAKESNELENDAPWRRITSLRNRSQQDSPPKIIVPEKENKSSEPEVILRRTQSFENDEKFYKKYQELRARIKANSCPVLPAPLLIGGVGAGVNKPTNNYNVQRSASLRDHVQLRKTTPSTTSPPTSPTTTTVAATVANTTNSSGASQTRVRPTIVEDPIIRRLSSPEVQAFKKINNNQSLNKDYTSATDVNALNDKNSQISMLENGNAIGGSRKDPKSTITTQSAFGNIFKNFFKSFVPPTRDEESETQRKAHAKRVRETRRSTQGVTLDEIKSAEKLVQKKNASNADNETMTTTTNLPFNDRVPFSGDNLDNTLDSTADDMVSETVTLRHPAEHEEISTSFTFNAPPQVAHRRESEERNFTQVESVVACDEVEVEDGGDTAYEEREEDTGDENYVETTEEEEEIVSASFTMPPPPAPAPTENVVLFNATLPTTGSDKNKTDDDVWETKRNSKTYIMATINVPATTPTDESGSNNNTLKTDSGELIPAATATTMTAAPISPTIVGDRSPLPKDDSKSTSPCEVTVGGGDFRLREKRSLFDMDNASSLTLAEKLRNEANKYSETPSAAQPTVDQSKNDEVSSSPIHGSSTERRPSWRLKLDAGCKFKLEDAPTSSSTSPTTPSTTSSVSSVGAAVPSSPNRLSNNTTITGSSFSTVPTVTQRRENLVNAAAAAAAVTSTARPLSAPASAVHDSVNSAKDSSNEVTLPFRKAKNSEDKENDKENDSRSAQATQAVIQRRRRPKRRSTGVVHVDNDENDPDRQESPVDGDDKESGTEQPSSRSRVGSTQDIDSSENGELIDYKALYEAAKAENDKLKISLRKKDEDLANVKGALDRFTNATTKNSLSELEKREKRAMERKISEMEEELKLMQKFKSENERLRAENRALTRVVSKLTTSAQNQLRNK